MAGGIQYFFASLPKGDLQRSPLTSQPAVANQGSDFREMASSGLPIGWMGSGCADNQVTNNDCIL
jgi:hypothetical protein